MGFGTSRSLESARRRARRMAQEEAGTYGTVQWRVVDADGRTVANGIENA
jgi:methionine-rich copper-binding protein CopC